MWEKLSYSITLFVSISLPLSLSEPIYLSHCLCVCPSVCLPHYLSPSMCLFLFHHLSIWPISLPVCVSFTICLSLPFCVSVHLSHYLFVCLTVCLSVSHLDNLLDPVDSGGEQRLDLVIIIDVIRMSHTHKQYVGGQARYVTRRNFGF